MDFTVGKMGSSRILVGVRINFSCRICDEMGLEVFWDAFFSQCTISNVCWTCQVTIPIHHNLSSKLINDLGTSRKQAWAHAYPGVTPPKHRSILLVIGIEDREKEQKLHKHSGKNFQKKQPNRRENILIENQESGDKSDLIKSASWVFFSIRNRAPCQLELVRPALETFSPSKTSWLWWNNQQNLFQQSKRFEWWNESVV